jgi:hypothetical protein
LALDSRGRLYVAWQELWGRAVRTYVADWPGNAGKIDGGAPQHALGWGQPWLIGAAPAGSSPQLLQMEVTAAGLPCLAWASGPDPAGCLQLLIDN